MKSSVDNILLFAECCLPNAVERLKRSASVAGYKTFGYLYKFNQKTNECVVDENEWLDFLQVIKDIADDHS